MFGAAKPAFGQGTNTFGGFNTTAAASPFGQSAFGKPATAGFGSGAFGAPTAQPAGGQPPTGLFGQTAAGAQPTSGLFGQPAQPTNAFGATQPQTGFGFGQNASTGLFGAGTSTQTLFGQNTAQPFGAKPQGFGFGATTTAPVGGLFGSGGSPGTGLFGQPTAPTPGTSGLFGTSGGFGVNTAGQTGTYIKYVPVSGTDVMVKNGHTQNVNTLHHCITCMKEYESKSLEELRMEDYLANRRGGNSLLGGAVTPFGQPGQPGTTTQPTGLFGQPDKPLFGQPNTAFGQPSTSTTGGLFGKPATTGFGAQPTTGTGFSFGSTTAGQSNSIFGAKPFATPSLFGPPATQAQPAPFSSQPTQGFGFGAPQQQTNTLFGAKPPENTGFGMPQTTQASGFGSMFGPPNNAQNTGTGLFGAKPAATPFGTAAPAFGAPNTGFGVATANTGGGLFGNTNAFGAKPATTGAPTFGGFNPTPTTNTGLGGGLNMGGGGLFGAKPAGGGLFGNTAANPQPGGLFGNTGGGLQLGGSTLGTGGTGFGTGAGLGFQGLGAGQGAPGAAGLGGGLLGGVGLNQQQLTAPNSSSFFGGVTSPPGATIHEQMIALTSKPFGHSPLLKDLVPTPGKVDEVLRPTNPMAQKSLLESGDKYKVSPGMPRLRVKPISAITPMSKKSLFDGLEENDPSVQETLSLKHNVKRLILRPKQIVAPPLHEKENGLDSQNGNNVADIRQEQRSPNRRSYRHDDDVTREYVIWDSSHGNRSSGLEESRSGLENSSNERELSPGNIQRRIGLADPRGSSLKSPLQGSASANTSDGESDRRSSWLTSKPLNKWSSTNDSIGQSTAGTAPLDSTVEQLLSGRGAPREGGIYPDLTREGLIGNMDAFDEESQEEKDKENAVPHPTGIKLKRPGYYTIPSMDELVQYIRADGTCIVPQFTVGRRCYGNVFFDCEMDVAGLDLDEIVHIMNKEIVIYPEEDNKPELGCGLNRRAQVTLDKVWPRDKTLRVPITDPERLAMMDYEAKLRRACDKIGTKFIEYRPQTGSWVFKVKHFSKYGLTESDEEDDDAATADPTKKGRLPLGGQKVPLPGQKQSLPGRGLGGDLAPGSLDTLPSSGLGGLPTPILESDDQAMDGSDTAFASRLHAPPSKGLAMDTSEENSVDTLVLYPDGNQSSIFGSKDILSPSSRIHEMDVRRTHTLQLMKASFYSMDNDMDDVGSVTDQLVPQGISVAGSTAPPRTITPSLMEDTLMPSHIEPFLHSGVEIKPPVVKPQTVMLRYHKRVMPFSKTIAGRLGAANYTDLSVANARLFRVGWGRGGQLTALSTMDAVNDAPLSGDLSTLNGYVCGRGTEDTSGVVTQRLRVAGGGSPTEIGVSFKDSIERHLEICLNNSKIVSSNKEGVCPLIVPEAAKHLRAAREHLKEDSRLSSRLTPNDDFGVSPKYWRQVWALCLALWGDHADSDADPDEASGARLLAEHAAFTEWLEECNSDEESRREQDVTEQDAAEGIVPLLACNRLKEACLLAQKGKNYILAAMLTQIKGDINTRLLAYNQLGSFRETCTDLHMPVWALKSLALAAGRPSMPLEGGNTLHTCQDRPWTQALALHYWYICDPIATVSDALNAYQRSFWEDCRNFSEEKDSDAGKAAGGTEVMEEDVEKTQLKDLVTASQADIDKSRVAYPFPPYLDDDIDDSKKKTLDLRYQLMSLRASRWKSLDSLINPSAHTADPLDYRLSWCLQQFLEALGYSHWSPLGLATLTAGFAAQLEAHGLWQWAIFVLQHIKDDRIRSHAVKEMVTRHAGGSEGTPARELLHRLGVPQEWGHQAEALLARYKNDSESEARHLTLAKRWAEAHVVVLDKLAPSYILNENGEALRRMLKPLVKPGQDGVIPDWNCAGHLFLEFLDIWDEVKSLVGLDCEEFSYRCESLKPRIASACASIAKLPTPTLKHVVARWEVGARLAQVGCAVVGDSETGYVTRASVRPLLSIISALDLPPDYTRLQLDKFIKSFTETEVSC